MKNKIGLFFGTFNPIHCGHIQIAECMLKNSDLKEIWFVVSPKSPCKTDCILLKSKYRLSLVKKVLCGKKNFKLCDIEFHLPLPSYTYNTLHILKKKYPDKKFVLVMGSDNLKYLPQWYKSKEVLNEFEIYVYPRSDNKSYERVNNKNIKIFDFPLLEVSSTMIRYSIKNNKNISKFLDHRVMKYINKKMLYIG